MKEETATSNLSDNCLQCRHIERMGYPIPDDEITVEIGRQFCPNCRALLSFERLECPVSLERLEALCDFVEEQLETNQCNHTLRHASDFCRSEHLPEELVLKWLMELRGSCDCEVLLNVAPRFLPDEKPNITFVDGEEMHLKHPNTFQIPSEAAKRAVRFNDLVKVCVDAERFWVKVTAINWPLFTGTVNNHLILTDDFNFGDNITFEARHILDIETVTK